MTSGGFRSVLESASVVALTDAFAEGTLAGRRSVEVAWSRYLKAINFILPNGLWSDICLMAMEALLIGFVCFEVSLRGMSPISTCNVYVPHITNSFAVHNKQSRFQEASRQRRYQLVARGLTNRYNQANPKCERAKAAFSLDMTIGSFWVRAGLVASLCYTAMRFGIFFLLRKGEFLHDPRKPTSGIRRSHVLFFTAQHLQIPYELVGSADYPAHSVRIQVTFSKTDQSGYGRLLEHVRQPTSGACIVRELERYIAYSRKYWKLSTDDLLFVNPDGSPFLSSTVASCMKDIAEVLGMDANKVSAHSLRYGGATPTAPFRPPQKNIAYYGGWKEDSESLRLYARPSTGSMALVSDCFAKGRADGAVATKIANTFGRSPLARGDGWV
jgi:hypothetical protein